MKISPPLIPLIASSLALAALACSNDPPASRAPTAVDAAPDTRADARAAVDTRAAADAAAPAVDAPRDVAGDVPVADVAVDLAPDLMPDLMPDVMRRPCPAPDAGAPDAARTDAATDAIAADARADAVAADARADAAVAAVDAPATDAVPARGEVLFLANRKVLVPGDEALAARLTERGFTVTMMQDADSKTEDAMGKALVVISASVGSGAIAAKFTTAATPVMNMEPFVMDDLKMTGPTSMTDYDFAAAQTEIFVVDRNHPMAAGLSCYATVSLAPGQVTWGIPGAGAEKVATIADVEGRWSIFGYKTGAMMVGAPAPARRVGWFASENLAPALSLEGLALFDAAVDWATAK